MELLGSGSGYKKYALVISSVGLLLTLACGASAVPTAPLTTSTVAVEPEAENEEILPESVRTEPPSPEALPESADAASEPVTFVIGSNVGERIPDFAITLVDGSTVTSAELLARRQPTFLFFFETW